MTKPSISMYNIDFYLGGWKNRPKEQVFDAVTFLMIRLSSILVLGLKNWYGFAVEPLQGKSPTKPTNVLCTSDGPLIWFTNLPYKFKVSSWPAYIIHSSFMIHIKQEKD